MLSLLADMIERGWTITFPPLEETRAWSIEVTKGNVAHNDGWGWLDGHEAAALHKAIESLHSKTVESDGKPAK